MTDVAERPAEAGDADRDGIAYRVCPLCEAGCGLEVAVKADGSVGRIRGDRDDVFSHGYICPKGSTLRQLHEDPDRLRVPVVKRDGGFVPVSWDEAFAEVERLLTGVVEAHGRERSPSTSATPPPTRSPASSTPGRSSGRSARPTSTRPAPSTSGPRRWRPG